MHFKPEKDGIQDKCAGKSCSLFHQAKAVGNDPNDRACRTKLRAQASSPEVGGLE
jgi:hypothetical protein